MKSNNIIPYVERDISWMYFNHRILQEAQREDVPLLERLSFIGIYSNNLDEFYRVRMATLSRIAESENKALKNEIESAKKSLKAINKLNVGYAAEFAAVAAEIRRRLREENIYILKDTEVNEEQKAFIRRYFDEKINGTTFPVWLSDMEQLGAEADDTIYLAVRMFYWRKDKKNPLRNYAVLPIPVKRLGRFLRLPDADGRCCMMYLDDVLRCCLPLLFAGQPYTKFEAYTFKFTKDAEMEMDNDLSAGKMQKVQKGIKSRKRGEPLRVIYDGDMPRELLKRVMSHLHLDSLDTMQEGGRYHNHRDYMSFPDCGRPDLKFPKWPSLRRPEFDTEECIFDVIGRKDLFVHVPYHSFDAYLRFLREAAVNPKVKSIKTTLYRLAKDSKVVESLIAAAKNKKKVTVIIELLARFDEESNIYWSRKLQDAGVEVIFGVEGLKIHSKVTWVETTMGNYAVIGTGNFHEGNARSYTDCMLFTASKTIVNDVERVFSFIQTPFLPVRFKELLVSPNEMRTKIVRMINAEIANHRAGKPAYIRMKINHITDDEMVKLLYAASAEGVEVSIVLRGNCSLVTGVKDISENIHITGIIDRYLEHSRILIFANGGHEKYYFGSADWMPRNLDHRIEVLTPIYDAEIQKELKLIVDFGLSDTSRGRVVDGTGRNFIQKWSNIPAYLRENVEVEPEPFRSQEQLYMHYKAQIDAIHAKIEAQNKALLEEANIEEIEKTENNAEKNKENENQH